MKKIYKSPEMYWVPIRNNKAIADVCWAYANNVKPFYYNTYGKGYAELYAVGGGCTKNVVFEIKYFPEDMTAEERALADADMQAVIARTIANMPNKPTSFKGSVFSPDLDPTWS